MLQYVTMLLQLYYIITSWWKWQFEVFFLTDSSYCPFWREFKDTRFGFIITGVQSALSFRLHAGSTLGSKLAA